MGVIVRRTRGRREDAGLDTGQDNGTLRVTIREAAARLGVTEAAVRKRIQRGSLGKALGEDGRVYVYLDLSRDTSHPESQIHHNPLVEELVEELRDRVTFVGALSGEKECGGGTLPADRRGPHADQQPTSHPATGAGGPCRALRGLLRNTPRWFYLPGGPWPIWPGERPLFT
jgi:hypothetical protein